MGHFRRLGPNDWRDFTNSNRAIKPIRERSYEPWKFFDYFALCSIYEMKHKDVFAFFYPFSTLSWHRWFKSLLVEDNNQLILHGQCHGCWWPGDARSQSISSHDIGPVGLEYPNFSTKRAINPQTPGNAWVRSQHCGYWCPGAKAPGHQYPQYWLNIQFIGPVSYENITLLLDNIRK